MQAEFKLRPTRILGRRQEHGRDVAHGRLGRAGVRGVQEAGSAAGGRLQSREDILEIAHIDPFVPQGCLDLNALAK